MTLRSYTQPPIRSYRFTVPANDSFTISHGDVLSIYVPIQSSSTPAVPPGTVKMALGRMMRDDFFVHEGLSLSSPTPWTETRFTNLNGFAVTFEVVLGMARTELSS